LYFEALLPSARGRPLLVISYAGYRARRTPQLLD
jgi:hypothetical protein